MSIFNKRKREYMIIPIIPIGAYFYIQNKTTLLITLLSKNITGKIFNKREYKKEKYEMKVEINNNMCYRLTALRQSLVFHKLMSLLSCASTIQQIENMYL